LGAENKPTGFFAPEMAYDEKILPVIEELGFKWLILDEISCGGEVGQVDYSKIYKIKNTNLNVFFRDRRLSNLIMSAVVRSPATLLEAMKDQMASGDYVVTAMDLESFRNSGL
jgi:alpha-amylase/alpha-mannosidase (GH57 family)